MSNELPDQVFKAAGYQVHHWTGLGDSDITVLHKEPFRFAWFATQVITFVFLIRRPVETFSQALDDYPALRKFAGEHKRTFLPFGIQCGYALLPIYIAQIFPESLIESIRSTYKKRWCVFHTPSLLSMSTGRVVTLDRHYLWGCIYRDYIRATVHEAANMVFSRTDNSSR
jgi:hypothetical protein